MSAALDTGQGQVLRALGIYLSGGGEISIGTTASCHGFVVLALRSAAWASLTFVGDRHHVVVRLPAGTAERPIDATAIDVPERIVAVERAVWAGDADGMVLTLDLLAIWIERDASAGGRDPASGSAPAEIHAKSRSFRELV